ncbi:hypothetical protein WJX73_002602 [Symbiochloris irregularis]|uniref:Uncharacterized protein n=1 Tax=Symbiochloris irregularis TaxID=706552 RepID=A0AAW1NS12_9CHLO
MGNVDQAERLLQKAGSLDKGPESAALRRAKAQLQQQQERAAASAALAKERQRTRVQPITQRRLISRFQAGALSHTAARLSEEQGVCRAC